MTFEGEITFLQQNEMWECKIREKKKLQTITELFHTRTILKEAAVTFYPSFN